MCGFIAAIGIYVTFPNKISLKEKTENIISKLSFKDKSVWPFLLIAALSSLCQASLLQSIGFFITDEFSNEKLIFTSLLVKSLKEIVNVSTGLILFTLKVELNTILSSDQFLGTPQSSTSEYNITIHSS